MRRPAVPVDGRAVARAGPGPGPGDVPRRPEWRPWPAAQLPAFALSSAWPDAARRLTAGGRARDVRAGLSGLIISTRPRQWLKNLLVLTAPVAAGELLPPAGLAHTVLAVAAFICASAGCYLFNDVRDRHADAGHPSKASRPIAAGIVSVRLAVLVGSGLCLGAVLLALTVPGRLAALVGLYEAVTIAYGLGLKAVPRLELAAVASGFVLRLLAGAAAAAVPVSPWLVAATGAAALHVVCSKRSSELRTLGARAVRHRRSLRAYTPAGLRTAGQLTAAIAVASYLGWVCWRPTGPQFAAAVTSLVALAVLFGRWMRRTEAGGTGAPEDVVAHDRVVRGAAVCWALAFGLSVLHA